VNELGERPSRGVRLQPEDLLFWQLADSAFPTGSFAHSGGLEAAWQGGEVRDVAELERFARGVVEQTASAVVPLLNAVHRAPERFGEIDQLANLFLVNPVANRASRVQGRALAATIARVWPSEPICAMAARVECGFGHQGPVMGAMFATLQVPLDVAQHICFYTAGRGVLAAAVRLGIAGSYEAQQLQHGLAPTIAAAAARARDFGEGDLAQTAPVLDVLQAAHDRLYSRLFQS
jgi:urease accessory protein